jgi:pimeloyl-ACP methyl ester carboxylesterase
VRVPTAFLLLLSFFACSSPRDRLPQIRELYERAALIEARNPVVVIHGILGARLEQRSTGKTVWGAFTSKGIDPGSPDGARALALPLSPPRSASDYDPEHEDVRATGPLEKLELSFLFSVLSVEVYANIIRALGAGGYTDRVVLDPLSPAYAEDHFTCFSFFYDWRRDNVQNAIEFGRYLERTRADIDRTARARIARLREAGETKEAREIEEWLARGYRFDVVAHSMGGLIAHYYLRYGANDLPADGSLPPVTWAGAEQIDRLVMVGTPNFGAMDALQNLVNGFQPAFILPFFHETLLGTLPSIYQLLPRNRHGLLFDAKGQRVDLDLFDPQVWEANRWGLFDSDSDRYLAWLEPEVPAAERRQHARAYLAWCLARARQFHAALDQRAPRPPTTISLFAADAEATLTRARLETVGGRFVPRFTGEGTSGPGDATVPRYSAVADERQGGEWHTWLDSPIPWSNVTFLADDHIGLTRNPHFVNNMLWLLLETRPPVR